MLQFLWQRYQQSSIILNILNLHNFSSCGDKQMTEVMVVMLKTFSLFLLSILSQILLENVNVGRSDIYPVVCRKK